MANITQMPLTRALAKVKTLKQEINEYFASTRHIFGIQIGVSGEKTNVTNLNKEGLERLIKGDVDSIKAKIANVTKIKQSICKANAVTMLTVNGVEMSIQDAIVLKETLPLRKHVLKNLKHHYSTVVSNINREDKSIEERIEQIISASIDKSSTPDTIMAVRERVRAEQINLVGLKLIDPCGVVDYIKHLEDEIAHIEQELDTNLSIINSTTLIEVEL